MKKKAMKKKAMKKKKKAKEAIMSNWVAPPKNLHSLHPTPILILILIRLKLGQIMPRSL